MSCFGRTDTIVNDQMFTIPVSLNINGNIMINNMEPKRND